MHGPITHSAIPVQESPNVEAPASKAFRSGLTRGLSCRRSWEWPLTREEKKERIRMLDREVLLSYKRELKDLQARTSRRSSHSGAGGRDSDSESTDSSCSGNNSD